MGGCLKRTPVCCSIRLRKSGGDIKSLSMRSTGTRSGTEYMQTDRPRFVILLFTIWSIIRNTLDLMGQYTARHQEEMLDYIYDHFDVFRLLLDGAHGTRFSCFLDELVDIEVEYTYKYMEVIGCESVKSGLVTEEFIHIIVTAYFNGMFEVVRHNMDRAAAHRYVKMLNRYHMAGFSTVFDPQP